MGLRWAGPDADWAAGGARMASICGAGIPLGPVGTPTPHSPAWGISNQNESLKVLEPSSSRLSSAAHGPCLPRTERSTVLARAGNCPWPLLRGRFRASSPYVSPLKAPALLGRCSSGRKEILKRRIIFPSLSLFFFLKWPTFQEAKIAFLLNEQSSGSESSV